MRPPKPKKRISKIPAGFEFDYMVYQLAEGDPLRAERIWNTLTFEDCVKFVHMKQYEALTQHEVLG